MLNEMMKIPIAPRTPGKDLDIPVVLNGMSSYEPVDGVEPHILSTEQWRQIYLDTVLRVGQLQADAIVAQDDEELDDESTWHKDHRPMTIPRLKPPFKQKVYDIVHFPRVRK
ncbi:uncharacterized protein N7511_008662 [Penicillium nucicola]|uniref:uncharacterized protein n=1 Tax=Penicillium nucicola TaxID=1850975 RepID=UPI0025457D6D|nr:uncharacterized protein N7511_008662 [Penicillium nucicola]KAJ5746966.1 hypothetical protein N7511_008662 [Penicillium nucicola]